MALLKAVPNAWRKTNVNFHPSIHKYRDEDIATVLKSKVSQYKRYGVNIKPRFVDTEKLNVISGFTRAYKYRQIEFTANRYKKEKIKIFKGTCVKLKDGSCSIVTPPVVEETAKGLVVIEGNTRATYCLRQGIEKFFCLLVKGVSELPPGQPWPLEKVEISERSLPPDERMENFDYGLFRHIERAIHPY